jgi:two-component system response regulator AtoC
MRILILDDEEAMRHMLSVILTKQGYEVSACPDAGSALKALAKDDYDFILSDIKMPGMDGMEFLQSFGEIESRATVIMMSAYGTIDTALECIKLGAYDYISKPFNTDEILLTIRKATEREKLKKELKRLKRESRNEYEVSSIQTKDPAMLELLALVGKVASYDSTVLITGETGTGKELIARALHYEGGRRDEPFVTVNCGAIPESLIESELFGHVKGAFTDAIRTKDGLFHEADNGTIFLDEIGELPRELQVKLLRVIQEGEVRRVGDTKTAKVDVRIVAATVKDLNAEVARGGFREDLFYRLNVIELKIPPLRTRGADIMELAELFLKRYCRSFSKSISGFTEEAKKLLNSYAWPGNVRELENVIERGVILEEAENLGVDSLPLRSEAVVCPENYAIPMDTLSIKKAELAIERQLIEKALKKTDGNRTKAAKLLEISHRALLYKIKNFKL